MRKLGIIIFAAALIAGVIIANIFSFGRTSDRLFNFSVNFCGTKGSGNLVTETRDVSGFDALDIGGIYKVDVTAGKDFSVSVRADDNLMPLIKTEVDGNVLKIESDGRISPSDQILVQVTAPDIRSLEVSGVANVDISELRNDTLSVDASGASKVHVSGKTSKLSVEVSGSTKVDAEQLNAENATVDASGASNVSLNVSGELRADASGASKVIYTGSPAKVVKDTSGGARVSPK